MKRKEIVITIDPASPIPMFLQIANGVVESIRSGRLAPGAGLPGSRSLSEQLDVSRNTVNSAYFHLQSKGWIKGIERSGYCVMDSLPSDPSGLSSESSGKVAGRSPAFDLPTRDDLVTSQMHRVNKLSDGLPDPRLMPTDELGKAYFYALRNDPKGVLDYGKPHGYKALRESLGAFLLEWRGMHTDIDSILVTRGNRMALNLLIKGLLKPGDSVAVEDPGNPVVWEIFRQAEIHLVGIPVDDQGLDVEVLANRIQSDPIRMLYLTPRFQIPTTVSFSMERRQRLLKLAEQHRFPIIEDDPEAEFTFDESPRVTLAEGEGAGIVIHLFSFSRLLAPGVRLGLLAGPEQVAKRLAVLGQRADGQGDQVLERAVADLLKEGEIQRHLQRARREYQIRRDKAIARIHQLFGSRLSVECPTGGLSLWIRTDPRLDLDLWCQRCTNCGVHFRPGRVHSLDRKALNGFLLGYASFEVSEMAAILEVMFSECPA